MVPPTLPPTLTTLNDPSILGRRCGLPFRPGRGSAAPSRPSSRRRCRKAAARASPPSAAPAGRSTAAPAHGWRGTTRALDALDLGWWFDVIIWWYFDGCYLLSSIYQYMYNRDSEWLCWMDGDIWWYLIWGTRWCPHSCICWLKLKPIHIHYCKYRVSSVYIEI